MPLTPRSLAAATACLVTITALHGRAHAGHDIVDTAVAAGSFETLVTALKEAELVDALRGDGPFTVFAPTDDAFAKIPARTLRGLLQPENRDQLVSILTYHVVPGRLASADVVAKTGAATLNGQRIDFASKGDRVTIDGAGLVKADIECENGIIHVIDAVIMPSGQTIVETAASAGRFNTLLAAAKAAGLAELLGTEGPFTVLAPTDEAFAAIPEKTLNDLLRPEQRDRLRAILTYHVIPGRVFAFDALGLGRAKTAQGGTVSFGLRDGRLMVNDAGIVANDIDASNGVIHVIDAVLMPPADATRPPGRLVVGLYTGSVDGALAAQLGVDADRCLLVTGLVSGGNAESAGIRQYDVIVDIDGSPGTSKSLASAKRDRGYGGSVRMTVIRRGERLRIDVPVGVSRH